MISYAGIGSRTITDKDIKKISLVGQLLSKKATLYSGNAEGADITFQKASNGNCVVFLPFPKFNLNLYSGPGNLIVPEYSTQAAESVNKYLKLDDKYSSTVSVHKIMMRNYHQVHGYKEYPRVSFVIACAEYDYRDVKWHDGTIKKNIMWVHGGTGQACRIAIDHNIPLLNVKDPEFSDKFTQLFKSLP